MVEFKGEVLEHLSVDASPEAVISTSRGTLEGIKVEKSPGEEGKWRTFFDLHVDGKVR